MILQLLYLRKKSFYNWQIWANYNFTYVILAPIVILQLLHLRQLCLTIVKIAPNLILQLSDLGQLYFYNCHMCASYDCTIVRIEPTIILQQSYVRQLKFYNCNFGPIMILKLLYLRQKNFYNWAIWATYNFTYVIIAPIVILQLLHLRQLCLTIVILEQIFILQLSDLGQLYFYNCHICASYDCTIVRVVPNFILQ